VLTYVAGVFFSLRTHKDLFNPGGGSRRRAVVGPPQRDHVRDRRRGGRRDVRDPVGSISEASESIGLSPFFVGVIVVAIVGNAADHLVAIYFAVRDKMDLAVNIAIGSSAQIALFAAPVLVLLSLFVGDFLMALVFNGFELGAVVLAVLIAQQVMQEGESTWFEGLQLLAVYAVLGLTFYFV
jgi:Ca2+:H+ antiporter